MLNSGLIFHTSSSIGIWIRGETGVFAQFAHRYSTSINGCSEPPVEPPKAGLGPGAPGLWPRLVAGLGERLGWYKGEELGDAGATAGCLGLGAGGA